MFLIVVDSLRTLFYLYGAHFRTLTHFLLLNAIQALKPLFQGTALIRYHILACYINPEIGSLPIKHNNLAEFAVRFRARKCNQSFPSTAHQGRCGPRTDDGKNAWDTFMTLAATCKKLRISSFDYIRDLKTKAKSIPPLAELIKKRAEELNLGCSYLPDCLPDH